MEEAPETASVVLRLGSLETLQEGSEPRLGCSQLTEPGHQIFDAQAHPAEHAPFSKSQGMRAAFE